MGLVFKKFETSVVVLAFITMCGCSHLPPFPGIGSGPELFDDRVGAVVATNTVLITELKRCLDSNSASIDDLNRKQLNISAVFVLDAKNSTIAESRLTRENDDTLSVVAIETCRNSATEKASTYFKERVLKGGFESGKGNYYMDGTLSPALDVVVSNKPKGTEHRTIYARGRAKDAK